MKSYGELKDDPDYQTWIGDTTGTLPPPGGESACDFQMRVLKGFTELLQEQEKRLVSSADRFPKPVKSPGRQTADHRRLPRRTHCGDFAERLP